MVVKMLPEGTASQYPGPLFTPTDQYRKELQFGKPLRKEFLIDPTYRNLNHASFGTIPRAIQHKLRQYQDMHEARPDHFIRYTYPSLLDESRAAITKLLRAPHIDEVVFVANASTGVNTVLRNLTWNADGKDEIMHFGTIYGACGKMIDYVVETNYGKVSARNIELTYPMEDADVVLKFKDAVRQARAEGKRPKVCVFDTVSSLPGVRFPFEEMVRTCKEEEILSLIDAAQGVGMIDLDLGKLDPDFLVSNCHKWLFTPRGCAVFYVPFRNQPLIRSTLPTSHGFVPKTGGRFNPLPITTKSEFVNNFEFVGTHDNSPYLCVKDAIEWREEVLGGEEKIRDYMRTLAKEGGEKTASILGTKVMENGTGTLMNCAMVNIGLPLLVGPESGDSSNTAPISQSETGEPTIPAKEAWVAWEWLTKVLVDEYKTFIPTYVVQGRFVARLSAQVYLDVEDFEWAGNTLKELCSRVARGEYKS